MSTGIAATQQQGESLQQAATRPHNGRPSPLGLPDSLSIAALSAALLTLSYLQSRHRIFWGDEIMGDLVLNAGSWHAFLERWNAGIDSSGFWFYVFAKPWESILGRSELALRMFSAIGVCTAASLIWATARRYYSFLIVGPAVAVVFLDINVLRWQLANGRCYGVLMAAVALVLFLILRSEQRNAEIEDRSTPSLLFLLATAAAYDLLAGSHILGVLYAGALLAMQIGIDLAARRRRFSLYAAAVVGIAAIIPFSLANIRSTTALGKPVFWTIRPTHRDLLFNTNLTENPVRDMLFVLFLVTLLLLHYRKPRRPVYVILLGFLLLDLVFFTISVISTSIYVDRYLLPFALALILLAAELLTQLREAEAPFPRLRAAAPLLILLWGLHLMPPASSYLLPQKDYTTPLLAQLPPGLPIVDTDPGSFVEVEAYHHDHFTRPFLFPLDPDVTADPRNPGGVSGFHEMDNFAHLGLDAPDLQPTEAILSRYPELLVITSEKPTAWIRKRLLEGGQYDMTDLGQVPEVNPLHVWLARHTGPPAIPTAPR